MRSAERKLHITLNWSIALSGAEPGSGNQSYESYEEQIDIVRY